MPDLCTHVCVAWLLTRILRRIEHYTTIFLIGNALPDILSRPIYMFKSDLYWFAIPIHTPAVMFLVSLLISFLFDCKERKQIFLILFSGTMCHQFMDLFQKHVGSSPYFLLFPLSWKGISLGLFWPEASLFFLPILVLLVLSTLLFKRRFSVMK